MHSTIAYPEGVDTGRQRRLRRAILALSVVLTGGTLGFMIIEPTWGLWRSLYFTLITVTTVGYSDEGLSAQGRGFTTILLVAGIATASYAFSQIVQAAVSYQFAWRRRMQKDIDRLRDHYVVCGMGRVGRAVCKQLTENSTPFVVIEQDIDRFQQAPSYGFLAILGTATEDAVLLQAGIKRARGIVCAFDSDSENIVITLSARELNADVLIVSRADDEGAVQKIKRAGASHVVSPALRGGADIANLLIRPHLTEFLEQSHGSSNGCRLAEVTIDADAPLVGQTLREYGDKEDALVFVAMKRVGGKMTIRPNADETFRPGDVVIVAGDPEAVVRISEDAKRFA